jgi:hypothetical protein
MQRIEKLRATIQWRKAVDNQWPLTPQEIEADNNRPSPPDDPFAN